MSLMLKINVVNKIGQNFFIRPCFPYNLQARGNIEEHIMYDTFILIDGVVPIRNKMLPHGNET